MDSNAFLNDLMSKMKLPEAKGKKKAEQSESVAQILAAMQKVRAEKKKPPVTSYIPPPNSGCRQRQKRKPTVLPAGVLKEEDKRGWTASDVRCMIANVRYCGSVLCQKTYTDHRNGHKQKVNKGEKPKYLIRNHHPAIISEELWQEAQEVWKAYTAKYRGIEK